MKTNRLPIRKTVYEKMKKEQELKILNLKLELERKEIKIKLEIEKLESAKGSLFFRIYNSNDGEFDKKIKEIKSEFEKEKKAISDNLSKENSLFETFNKNKINESILLNYYLKKDNTQCKLPILDKNILTDYNKGIWELYIPEELKQDYFVVDISNETWEIRNPDVDIKEQPIAIDFGTSSTVVSYRDSNGKIKLIRIGAQDLYQKPQQKDYENPTVLHVNDFKKFMNDFSDEFFRPYTNWDDTFCSHKALDLLKDNINDSSKIGSILTVIKRWALTSSIEQKNWRFKDLKGFEFEVPSLKDENFNITSDKKIKTKSSEKISANRFDIPENYDFNPVEIYAYYLGLFINTRANGIFLKYYMTFPVSYPKGVKSKILSSFKKGLLRSLPNGVIDSEKFKKFSVEEIAQEPAAYAACAIDTLKLVNDNQREIDYAVFDFGGGTADFDYGKYRFSTDEEYEASGFEYVIERFASNGDSFLGGENIIENLSYTVFKQNIDICRENKIIFTKPANNENFAGSEVLIDNNSSIAKTNTTIIMAKMREIWENFEGYQAGKDSQADFNLININNENVDVKFKINYSELNSYIAKRIFDGIYNFFSAMKELYNGNIEKKSVIMPKKVDILLGGNSSKSKLVQSMFFKIVSENLVNKNSTDKNIKNISDNKSSSENSEKTNIEQFNKIVDETKTLKELFPDWSAPKFQIHLPLEATFDNKDSDYVYKPTGKTGVAIGLLKLLPGETLCLIDPKESEKEEAPFAYYVGKYIRDSFKPILSRNDFLGKMEYFGVSVNGSMVFVYTTSPQASGGELKRGDNNLVEKHLQFENKYIYGRVVGPNEIEISSFENQADSNKDWIKCEKVILK